MSRRESCICPMPDLPPELHMPGCGVFQLLVIETARKQERQAVVAFIRAWANAAAPWKRITRELLQVAAAIEGWGAGGAPPPGSAATGPAPAGRAADAPSSQPDPRPPSQPSRLADLERRGLLLSETAPCLNCGRLLSEHVGGRCPPAGGRGAPEGGA